jgi:hypothetical protein
MKSNICGVGCGERGGGFWGLLGRSFALDKVDIGMGAMSGYALLKPDLR